MWKVLRYKAKMAFLYKMFTKEKSNNMDQQEHMNFMKAQVYQKTHVMTCL